MFNTCIKCLHNLTNMEIRNKCIADVQTALGDSKPCIKNPYLPLDYMCLTPLQHYFSYIMAASAPTHVFQEFFIPVLSHITIYVTMDSGKSRMNPIAMTIIRKNIGPV